MNNHELNTNALFFVMCWIDQFKPNQQGFDKLLEVSSEGPQREGCGRQEECRPQGLRGRPVRNLHLPVAPRAVYPGHEEANVSSRTLYFA